MRLFRFFQPLFFFIVVIGLAACSKDTLLFAVDKGIVEGEYDITLTQKNVKLKNDEMFRLSALGIEASTKEWKWNTKETVVQYAILKTKKYKYPGYDITITKKGSKTYFGKLLFFNLSDEEKAKARVFYKIKIDAASLEEAKGGQIKCINDAPKPTGKKAASKILKPTWIIWMSDTRL